MALFTIKGVYEIQRAFETLPGRVAKKVVRQAIRKALRPMKAAVERNAPRYKRKTAHGGKRDSRGRFVATGLIAKNVKIRARAKRRRGDIALDVQIGEGDYRGATFYAAFPNFGTRYQLPQHYMERSFHETEDQSRSIAADEIHRGMLREWKNL